MRWQSILGLLLIGVSAWLGRDLMKDDEHPWPAYAEPQASCGTDLSGIHDGVAIKFRYPNGWRVAEKQDPSTGIVSTFLTPSGGAETTLFLREAAVKSSIVTVPTPGGVPPKLRDAPGPVGPGEPFRAPNDQPPAAEPVRLKETDQALTFDERRHGNAYLTRTDESPQRIAFSWMAFVWDTEGRMTAVSGPKLMHSNWPNRRRRAREINCAFWEVLRTIEPK